MAGTIPNSAKLPKTSEWFDGFARNASHLCGKPITFLLAVGVVIVWAVTGPIFQYSDTWQLVINTGTTIITFLMVFLIQNTQNRDSIAVQVKLAELIIAVKGAHNRLANCEDLSEDQLETLHAQYRELAKTVDSELDSRRKKTKRQEAV